MGLDFTGEFWEKKLGFSEWPEAVATHITVFKSCWKSLSLNRIIGFKRAGGALHQFIALICMILFLTDVIHF